jgi:predicted DNA repair protein MutK
MTAGVYGLVGAIVKLDDRGAFLSRRAGAAARASGHAILSAAPWLMRGLTVGGTIAMFLVGGTILAHGVPPLHHWLDDVAQATGGWERLVTLLLDAAVGLVAGALLVTGYTLANRVRGKRPASA